MQNAEFRIQNAMRLLVALAIAATMYAAEGSELDYSIVVTGEELLRGSYPDAHVAFITRTLQALGCHCVGASIVDDKIADPKDALRTATQKAPLVIVTGGLGPTVNDVTREALAEFTGVELREQPEVLAELERRFNVPRDQLRPNIRRQAMTPMRGTYLKASFGTAAGLVFEWEGKVIIALPGPPRELQPMVRDELTPYLQKRFGVRSPGSSITLRFVGIGQSLIDQTLSRSVPLPPDVVVGSQFEAGRVDFTFMLPGKGPEEEARLKELAAKLHDHLGEYIYADDGSSLEEQVVRMLLARGAELKLVEIGTGGRLAASLAGLPGTTRLLKGAYVAPSEQAMRRLLKAVETTGEKPESLKVLAEAAGGEWTIVTGELTTDDAGARSCSVLFRLGGDRWGSMRVPAQGSGDISHTNLVTQTWDRLRRLMLQP